MPSSSELCAEAPPQRIDESLEPLARHMSNPERAGVAHLVQLIIGFKSAASSPSSFQRVLASGVVDAAGQRRINAVYRALDPVRLLHQLKTLQEALWHRAVFRTRGSELTR